MLPSLSIIIVNYNTADLLPPCLDSVLKQEQEVQSIIVIDNNSSDDSVAVLNDYQSQIQFIANERNIGFGAANNIAAHHTDAELLFLLNPDTLLHQGCLAEIKRFMSDHEGTGLAGVQIYNEHGEKHDSIEYTYPGNNYTKGLLGDLPGEIAWVLGAGMVVKKSAFEAVNGFDEDFFLYGEDIDICLRMRQKGVEIGFIKQAGILHYEGQSERLTEPAVVAEKKLNAEVLFYCKHYPAKYVKKIKRARMLQAMWRIFTLRCFSLLGNTKNTAPKLIKYETVLKVYSTL